ncbi:MAG: TolC family protein [Prevotella sp.]|nr:TolC family protein [Prevotella sp.]MBQ9655718.1 TolC family protein [Prevotella sp.]
MNTIRRSIIILTIFVATVTASAQYNKSGISAGFFDSSGQSEINFADFHLPPLAVLYENAKQSPRILTLEKAQELAKAEVAKQKRHIFSYVTGHASYSYGKTDMWGQGTSAYTTILQQYQGSEQSYWNVGVNVAVPLEDILDLAGSVKRKRLEVARAAYDKDMEFEALKKEIGTLYVKITNSLVTLKTAGEGAAIYQGAGALNLEDFHQGNMSIENFAYTKLHELSVVKQYQELQTQITSDIITLEILSHTPILTNTTTEITLDDKEKKSEKEIRKENKAIEKKIRKVAAAEEKKYQKMEAAEKKAQEKAAKAAQKNKK